MTKYKVWTKCKVNGVWYVASNARTVTTQDQAHLTGLELIEKQKRHAPFIPRKYVIAELIYESEER